MSGTLQDRLDALFERRLFGVKLGLDSMHALLEALGNPHLELACVHVAGTNGKGSVCAMLESVLRRAGLRPGLYTSPHLVRVHERFRVDGNEPDDATLVDVLDAVERADLLAQATGHREATFFEMTTAMAFEHFRRTGVRIAVIETGLGGRLDATNVVDPLLSVITSIDLDHQLQLGTTLEEIAAEKGGIIKANRDVVIGALGPESEAVVTRLAQTAHAPLLKAADAVSIRRVAQDWSGQKIVLETTAQNYGTLTLKALGPHQLDNCATAIASVERIGQILGLEWSPKQMKAALGDLTWRARMEQLCSEPPVLLDGGHNPACARASAQTLEALRGQQPIAMVLGMMSDKDVDGFLQPFRHLVKRCWTVTVQAERGAPASELARHGEALDWSMRVSDELSSALQEATNWASAHEGIVFIAGSLYLAGEVLALEERHALPWSSP